VAIFAVSVSASVSVSKQLVNWGEDRKNEKRTC